MWQFIATHWQDLFTGLCRNWSSLVLRQLIVPRRDAAGCPEGEFHIA
jgi:hypothetical protein